MADVSDSAVPVPGQSKTCTKCGERKLLTEFNRSSRNKDGRWASCRECQKPLAAAYYAGNRAVIRQKQKQRSADPDRHERYKEYQREYYRQNRERVLARMKTQRDERPTPLSPERKAKIKLYMAQYMARYQERKTHEQRQAQYQRALEWDRKNPERRREIIKKHRQKRLSTPKGMLENFVRNGVYRGIRHGSKAGRRTFELLGYTVEQLKTHIEQQLTKGMSWDNYGEWEIDHKIPLAVFNYETPDHVDFKRAWALTNLQPMWASENRQKNAKLSAPFQPSLMIT